jgi:HTH-type transcriptional regulator/antitoxin HigA
VIESDKEFNRLAALMEDIDFKENPTAEERPFSALLMVLIRDYDDRHHSLPETTADAVIRVLMEQKGLTQADLLPVFGSPSVASDVINGNREPSTAHIRKLVEFSQVPADLFL